MKKAIALSVLLATLSLAQTAESLLVVTVPDYTIEELGNLHYITLPGGGPLMSEGKPQLPFYPVTVRFAGDCYIQDVELTEKAGQERRIGIRLPQVTITLDTVEMSEPPIPARTEGFYPGRDFNWSVWHSRRGGTELVLSVYPFQFNSQTTELIFHKNYRFRIRYRRTGIATTGLRSDQTSYEPGQQVTLLLGLTNSAQPQDVRLLLKVDGAVSAALPEMRFRIPRGDTTLNIVWQPPAGANGDCEASVMLKDDAGATITTERTPVRFGNPEAEITSFTAQPTIFRAGDTVRFVLQLRNIGTWLLSGSCTFRILKGGAVVFDTACPYAGLAPGSTTTVQAHWNTARAERGPLYYAVAFAGYVGTTTAPQTLELSTNQAPEPLFDFEPATPRAGETVALDASRSTDPDGTIAEYRWDFGDGGSGITARTSHTFQLAGSYPVTLTVIDNEGRQTTLTKTVTVRE